MIVNKMDTLAHAAFLAVVGWNGIIGNGGGVEWDHKEWWWGGMGSQGMVVGWNGITGNGGGVEWDHREWWWSGMGS
jgi:hypothetical protein